MSKVNKILDNQFHAMSRKQQVEWLLTAEGDKYIDSEIDAFFSGRKSCADVEDDSIEKIHSDLIEKIQGEKRRSGIARWRVALAAASIIPLILISSMALYYFNKSSYTQVSVEDGDMASFTLNDGTRVSLNSGTTLRYPNTYGLFSRRVELSGQAYFDVEASKLRPFIIDVNGIEVVVTGTRFDVEAYEQQQRIVVSLDKGVVSFKYDGNSLTLLPKQKLVFDRDSKRVEVEDVATPQFSAWTNNIITAHNIDMEHLLFKLSKKFDVHFAIKDSVVYENSYTLTLRDLTLDQILHKISKLSPVTFQQRDDVIEVTQGQ